MCDCGGQLVLQPPDQFDDRSRATRLVGDIVAPLHASDSQELHVRARQVVLRALAEHEDSGNGGDRFVDGQDHLRGGEAFFNGPVVRRERLGSEGRRQIVVLKAPQLQIGERGALDGPCVEARLPMPALFVQRALVAPTNHLNVPM